MKTVTVTLLLDVENDAEAADGANEILREQQRSWAPGSCLIDYRFEQIADSAADPNTHSEGDPF